jgi:hypothetical protein
MEASVAAPPAQGTPTESSQPPAGGQGQQQQGQTTSGQGGTGFNWGNFPNIPEGQRSLLEPHLKDIQGYTTRLEQQIAPYRSLMQAVPEDQVQSMLGFLNQWGADPLNTWMGLAQSLKDDGLIQNPAFSIETLNGLLSPQQQAAAQAGQAGQVEGDVPMWAQQLQARLGQMEQAEQQRVAQAEEQEQAQLLTEAQVGMKQTLVSAGLPEDLLSNELLNGAIIAHNGDVPAATTMITNMREAILRGFTESNGSGPKPPTIVGGAPQAPKNNMRPKSGDGFRSASVAAEQALRAAAASEAQG